MIHNIPYSLPHCILFQTRSCNQNKKTFVIISVSAMPLANNNSPVINHDIINVSIVPVKRQLIAFAKLRVLVSFNA
jgi:hypothetical protein